MNVTQGNGLTPPQLRIAEAAARGKRTREIAADLFLSPKTPRSGPSTPRRAPAAGSSTGSRRRDRTEGPRASQRAAVVAMTSLWLYVQASGGQRAPASASAATGPADAPATAATIAAAATRRRTWPAPSWVVG